MRNTGRLWSALGCAVVLTGAALWNSGCSKSTSPPPPTTGTVSGRVIDASASTPIAGAVVSSGTTQATTTADGLFTLTLPAGTANITVKHAGYTLNQLVVTVTGGTDKQATVGLLTVGAAELVSAAAGGSVTDAGSKAVISLPPNFVAASGDVTVSITGLDPTTGDVRALPGGLEATDVNGRAVYLNAVSFAEYTVTDAAGNVLPFNASAGAGADIELPIPASLLGQPGYHLGDPIECYLYDPADGKWKTPVTGMIGPSSVDGSPAIKATIFHLSWYGGAQASNDITCVDGHVRNANGSPAAGVSVEAFPGSASTTDTQGFYRLNASPNSTVRVAATKVNGTNIQAGEVEVYTGAAGASCEHAPDITLGEGAPGIYHVLAILVDGEVISDVGQPLAAIGAIIELESDIGSVLPISYAKVEVNGGAGWVTVPFAFSGPDSGIYALHSPSPGFTLTGGQTYDLRIDYDNNGTIDASGQVQMTGVPVNTNPPGGGTVGKTFTASWSDPASAAANYAPTYWLELYGPEYREYVTDSRSYVVGNGIADSTIYGFPMPNDSLSAGSYNMSVWAFEGPLFFGPFSNYFPNISGQSTDGYFASYSVGHPTGFTCTGTAPRTPAGRRPGISRAKRPSGPVPPQMQRLLDRLKRTPASPQRVARAR